jgi:hypothetical protein
MTCQIIKSFTVASILLATVFFNEINAQEAEKLFHEKYSKISLVLQPSRLEAGHANNYDNSTYPSLVLNNSRSLQAGFYYDFAQSGRFNFKTGLIFKELSQNFDLNISNDDIGNEVDYYLTDMIIGEAFIFTIPLKTECFIPITPKINVVAGLGIGFGVTTDSNIPTRTGVSVGKLANNGDYESKKVFSATTTGGQKGFESEVSFGFNYKTRFALYQLEIYYSQSFWNPIIEGDYTITNLAISDDKIGRLTVYNNFYGLSLSVTPKKKWLVRKSKR